MSISIYKGNKKIVINNLLERDDKGNNYSVKNFDGITYHWGCELIEAIKNDFEIEIFEINEYECKEIFTDFSNYFYNERKKLKKINPSKALYYKYILNSLYGKFGQKQFEKNKLVKNNSEIWKEIKGNITMLKNIENIDDELYLISYEEKGDNLDYIGNLTRFSSYISALSRCKLSEVMRNIGHENIYYWNRKKIDTTNMEYYDYPWEIDAYGREVGLVYKFFKKLRRNNRFSSCFSACSKLFLTNRN